MNGVVGLVAFCVLCACFLASCFAVMFWARDVKCELELLDWRSARAGRSAEEANNLIRMSWGTERKLEARIWELELRADELEAEVADHRAFLNFIEDYTIEADATGIQEVPSGCDCCNPELD